MAVGHKSPKIYLKVWDGNKYVFILVQASRKTLGICDIVETVRIKTESVNPKTKKKEKKYEYHPIRRLNDVLSKFQGQQFNNPEVIDILQIFLDSYMPVVNDESLKEYFD